MVPIQALSSSRECTGVQKRHSFWIFTLQESWVSGSASRIALSFVDADEPGARSSARNQVRPT